MREKRKEEQGGKRTLTRAALCAASIRTELKNNFPTYKFSVTSDNFSGGDSVHISWNDGPTTKQVDSIVNKYQYGHFDGMTDMYEYSNTIDGLPQTKYVSTSREINPELKNRLLPEFEKLYKSDEPEYSRNSTVNTLHRILSNTEIKNADNVKGIKEIQQNGSFEDCFKLTYHKNEKETVQADTNPNIKPIESAAGEVNIIEYSERAIAVIGDTKPIKELLKSLGGSFNARLSCGPGWIFSKKKLEEVQTALINKVKHESKEDSAPVLYSEAEQIQEIEIVQAEQIQEMPSENLTDTEEPDGENLLRHSEMEYRNPLNVCDSESGQYKEVLMEHEAQHPKKYDSLQEITAASNTGKQVSIYNLFSLIQETTQA
jgi:hypothetical protein